MLYNCALKTQRKIKGKISKLEQQVANLPEGKFIFSNNGKYHRWYHSDGHHSVTIPKSNKKLAEQLAYKRFLNMQLKHLKQELSSINFYLRHHDTSTTQKELDFVNTPGIQELISPYFQSPSKQLSDWANASYEQNTSFPEGLVHKTLSGKLVRSKSESMIDMILSQYQLAFRYEPKLILGEIVVYPDFVIRHPQTGELFYWEHFGKLDDPKYVVRMNEKLQVYISHGIIPSVNLILTFETSKHPLTIDKIERLVEEYFF